MSLSSVENIFPSCVSSDAAVNVIDIDGGWCWFESPICLLVESTLLIGSVASGYIQPERKGNIELIYFDCLHKKSKVIPVHNNLELDDHDGPALLLRNDNKLLVMWAKHSEESHNYYNISTSPLSMTDYPQFSDILSFTPSESTRLTYSNLYSLSDENDRIYNFYRGFNNSYKPSYCYSDNQGQNWMNGNVFIDLPSNVKHRPYVRYNSNYKDTIHMIMTEGHPRDYDNSIYHCYYKNNNLYRSDSSKIIPLSVGLSSPIDSTLVYAGNKDHVAWTIDLVIEAITEIPTIIYSIQYNSAGLPVGEGGDDIRYEYAKYNKSSNCWVTYPLAYAGSRLYAGEDDYSGLACIDPTNINIVYISTNSNPLTGEKLISSTDQKRHYELYRGITSDEGKTWQWESVTNNSIKDNLRPICPHPQYLNHTNHTNNSFTTNGGDRYRALIWLRGTYRSYTDYDQEVMAITWKEVKSNSNA